MSNIFLWVTISAVIALVIGGYFGATLFPAIKEVPVIQKEIEYVNQTVEVPVEKIVEVPVEVEVEKFNPFEWRDAAWEFVLGDYFSDLKYCGNETYHRDEIDWDFGDAFSYAITDLDKNDRIVEFTVDGDYDNECEVSYLITVEYYKNNDPTVTIV